MVTRTRLSYELYVSYIARLLHVYFRKRNYKNSRYICHICLSVCLFKYESCYLAV